MAGTNSQNPNWRCRCVECVEYSWPQLSRQDRYTHKIQSQSHPHSWSRSPNPTTVHAFSMPPWVGKTRPAKKMKAHCIKTFHREEPLLHLIPVEPYDRSVFPAQLRNRVQKLLCQFTQHSMVGGITCHNSSIPPVSCPPFHKKKQSRDTFAVGTSLAEQHAHTHT